MKNTIGLIAVLSLMSVFIISGCVGNGATVEETGTPGELIYTHYDFYKIIFPSTWTKSVDEDLSITFKSPYGGVWDDYREYLNIMVFENTEGWTLGNETVDELMSGVEEESMGTAKLIKSELKTLSGNEARKITYTANVSEIDLSVTIVWTIKENYFYLLSYGYSPNSNSNYLDEIETMVSSFEII